MESGIYSGIEPEIYHSGDEISVSGLKTFSEEGGPAKYRYGVRDETPSLRLGTLVHTAILEAETFEGRYFVTDLQALNENHGAVKAEMAKAGPRTLVKRADYEKALRMQDAVYAHPAACQLLSGKMLTEQSFYWTDPGTGLACRGRADVLRLEDRAMADVKSAVDGGSRGFAEAIFKYRYHWQDQFYAGGMEQIVGDPFRLAFIAVEPERPHLVAVYEVDAIDQEYARQDLPFHLANFAKCKAADEWPGYPDHIQTLSLRRRINL